MVYSVGLNLISAYNEYFSVAAFQYADDLKLLKKVKNIWISEAVETLEVDEKGAKSENKSQM